jgi:hypothetical protein
MPAEQEQLARLRAALDGGPAARCWDQDKRWTLARAAERDEQAIAASKAMTWVKLRG